MTLKKFWQQLSVWSQATFGADADRGPAGPLKHLALEVQECLADPTDLVEYADLIFLTFDACRRAGFTYDQLTRAIEAKLKVNMARKWGKPSSGEPVCHIK